MPSPVALLLACALAAEAPGASPVAAQVERVLAAHGGRAALERAAVLVEEGTVTSLMHPGTGRMVRVLARPDSLRVEVRYPGEGGEVRVLHRGRGERDGVDVTGTPAYDAMVLQAARLALPLSLAAPGARVTDGGVVERDGQRRPVIVLAVTSTVTLTVELDPATHRIARSSGTLPGPMGRMEFATDYGDYRAVRGVLVAMREENWASGRHTGTTRLERVELPAAPPPGTFPERI